MTQHTHISTTHTHPYYHHENELELLHLDRYHQPITKAKTFVPIYILILHTYIQADGKRKVLDTFYTGKSKAEGKGRKSGGKENYIFFCIGMIIDITGLLIEQTNSISFILHSLYSSTEETLQKM